MNAALPVPLSHITSSLYQVSLFVTAGIIVWFIVSQRGLQVDGLAAAGLVHVAPAVGDLLLGHYSVDF